MTSEELKAQLEKQKERERFEYMITEYLRIKKILIDLHDLTHEEACLIALHICEHRELFYHNWRPL